MIRPYQRVVIATLAAALATAQGTAFGLDPLTVVREVARLDGAGARLSPVEWRKIAPLVEWPVEPAWDRLILIKAYEITTPRRSGDDVEVDLRYNVSAEVTPGKVVRKKRQQTVRLTLTPTPDGGWLVRGPPHPPFVFENASDPEALAQLLEPSSKYESNSALVWRLLREDGANFTYTRSADIPASPHLMEVATGAAGDVVGYYADGEPYQVGVIEDEESVVSSTLSHGRQILPFSAFSGPTRYWRPIGRGETSVAASPDAGAEEKETPAPRRRR